MTKDRDFKRRIRERMQKTGESYTAARARLLSKAGDPATEPRPPNDLPHPEIVQRLHAAIDSGWWRQTVTVGYERLRGLREPGQRGDGHYEANRSRGESTAQLSS